MKKLILIAILLSMLPLALGFDVSKIQHYYSFDVNADDDVQSNDGTPAAGMSLTGGKLNDAYTGDGSSNGRIDLTSTIDLTAADYSICYWGNHTANDDEIAFGNAADTNNFGGYDIRSSSQQRIKNSAGTFLSWSYLPSLNTWVHYCYVVGQGTDYAALYINGALNANVTGTDAGITVADFFDGYSASTLTWTGALDEILISNVSLSAAEVSELYNGGAGFNPLLSPTQTIEFISPTPADGAHNNTQVNITFNSSTGYASFWFGSSNPPTTQYFDNVSTGASGYTWTTNVTTEGTYYYFAGLPDYSLNTSVRSWVYDTVEPAITLNPNNGFTSSNGTVSNPYLDTLQLNITASDDIGLYGFQVLITDPSSTVKLNYTNESLSGTSFTYVNAVNTSSWDANTLYTVAVLSSDSHTAKAIPDYQVSKRNRELSFQTAEGNSIQIVADKDAQTDAIKQGDRYKFSFDFSSKGAQTRSFDVISDKPIRYMDKSPYVAHFVIWNAEEKQGNWVDFEGAGSNPNVIRLSDTHYRVVFTNAPDKVTFNSIGGLNVNEVHYSWYKGATAASAPQELSGAPFTLSLNVTHEYAVSSVFAGLDYNGTDYSSNVTRDNQTGHTYFSATLPGIAVDADSTQTFSWNVSYVASGDGTNGSFHVNGTHTLLTFVIDSCTTANAPTRVFNIFEENTPDTALNGTVQIDGTYWGDNTNNRTLNLSYASVPATLCMSPNSTTLYGDLYIKYEVPTGFTHRWFIVNGTFTNESVTVDMGNYNDTTGISDLKITVRRVDNFKFFPEIIGKLQRRYPSEGVWRTVQMDQSGDYGLLFFNIREEDTDYRLIFMDRQNHILKTTASVKFVCSAGVCEITQQLNPYSDSAASITPVITHTFDNSTKLLTVAWTVTSGDSVTLTSRVSKETLTGTSEICSSSASGSSGTIVCNTTGYDGELLVVVSQGETPDYSAFQDVPATKLSDLIETAESAFWAFGILVTIIMFGAILGPAGVAISTVLGVIVIFLLGIFGPVTLSFVAVAAVLGMVVAIKVRT